MAAPIEQRRSVPKQLLHRAKRTFLRRFRAFEAAVLASNVDEDEIELETDIEPVVVATGVNASMVQRAWEREASLELSADGMLLLTGVRDNNAYFQLTHMIGAVFVFGPVRCKVTHVHHSLASRAGSSSQLVTPPPGRPKLYPTLTFTMLGDRQTPRVVVELDIGYHSMTYWLARALAYLQDCAGVSHVVVVKLFPLRHSALAAGQWKRAAVALVLGRIAIDKKDPLDWEMGILQERSFGNVPLATNIRQILATVSTPTNTAPRGDIELEEPYYPDLPTLMNEAGLALPVLVAAAEQFPHTLTLSVEGSPQPWSINLGVVLSAAYKTWYVEESRRRAVTS